MVAVTVILAAIIAAFVFGMAGNVKSTKVVAFTVERTGATGVTATFMGGQDAGAISSVSWQGLTGSAFGATPSVGSTKSATASAPGTQRVILVATFNDGTQQVVLDKTL